MNERIRELAVQAGFNIPDDSVYNGHIHKNVIERFANLLEKEFFSQGYQAGKSDGIRETVDECCVALQPMLRDMISRGHALDLINKHFGVE